MRSPRSFSIVVRRKSGELVGSRAPPCRRTRRNRAACSPLAVRARGRHAGRGGEARLRGAPILVGALRAGSSTERGRDPVAPATEPAPAGGAAPTLALLGRRARHAASLKPARARPDGIGAGGEGVATGAAPVDVTIAFALVLFVVLPQAPPRLANRRAHLAPRRPLAALPGADRRLQAHHRGRLPAAHSPRSRDPARFSVSRRRAQDDQHLRGGRGARSSRTRARSPRSTLAAERRSSSWWRWFRSWSSPRWRRSLPHFPVGGVVENVMLARC